jgi:hypothetical protein
VRAINVDEAPDAQRADVALLLGLVDDPDAMARELSSTERKWLKRHSYLADPESPQWDDFHADDLEQSALVYGRLMS